jgi:putative addiction module killer protein
VQTAALNAKMRDEEGFGAGEGNLEFRGYGVYYKRVGAAIVGLLCGGDKDSQQRDIALAKKLAAELEG